MKKSNNQQLFLLTFFDAEGYSEKELNGFWLVKNWDGNTKEWRVNVYTKESFKNYKQFTQDNGEKREMEDRIRAIIRGES